MQFPYHVGASFTLQPKNKESQEQYISTVIYLTSQHICIELPTRLGGEGYGFFPLGTELNVSFVGKDNLYYEFESSVVGRKKEDKPVVYISHPDPEKFVRKQRRNYVRVPTEVEVIIYPASDPHHSIHTKTVDLSGGGLSFNQPFDEGLAIGENLRLKLRLPMSNEEEKEVEGIGQIKRIESVDEGVQYAVQFTDIIEEDRQIIIQYCFNIQLEMRGKRLRS